MSQIAVPAQLVENAFYISPLYESNLVERNTRQKLDEEDTFPEWMRFNLVQRRQFMGENGVFGSVFHFPQWTKGSILACAGNRGPYNRIVRIDSMPVSRELPGEILTALAERDYVLDDGSHPGVRYGLEHNSFK